MEKSPKQITLETAKLLKDVGFDEMSRGQVTEYLINVFDPEYPDGGGPFSMKKGEIEYSNDWGRNSYFKEFSAGKSYKIYSCPERSIVGDWIMRSHNTYIYPIIKDKRWGINAEIINKVESSGYFIINDPNCFDTYDDAMEFGIKTILKLIKNEKKNKK